MNLHSFSSVISFISWAGSAAFILSKARSNIEARRFSVVAVCAGLWTLFPFLLSVAPDQSVALALGRITYVGGILIPPTLLHFSLATTGLGSVRFNRRVLWVSYGLGFAGAPLLLGTPWFFNSVITHAPHFVVVPGP